MRVHLSLLLLGSLASTQVLAGACDVMTRSSSQAVKPVEQHTCYSFSGMPDEAIAWSCSNESKEMLTSTKKKVAQCDDHYQASCVATLTQESLANPHSTSKDKNAKSPNIPDNAQVTTYYYDAEHLSQVKADCESGGGHWKTR